MAKRTRSKVKNSQNTESAISSSVAFSFLAITMNAIMADNASNTLRTELITIT